MATASKVEPKINRWRRYKLCKLIAHLRRKKAGDSKEHTKNDERVEHPYAPTGKIKHELGPNELEKQKLGLGRHPFNPSG